MKVLGVAVSSGILHFGALEAPQGADAPAVIAGAPARLVPAAGLAGAERLADTFERITQDLRILAPDAVALVGTRKHGSWTYREATERISLISALMLSCAQQNVAYEELKTERIGKLVGIPPASLATFSHETIGLTQRPSYWTAGRGAAFAAALAYVTDGSEN
ncbi:hypothetical protein ACFRNT_16150 [Streptomyces sp. NPDC056697]|uniref:hypothetical protein n=1 Tax=Streptomyces sp. NPDC056697 TaxID=3345915 RepID=UPI00369758CF